MARRTCTEKYVVAPKVSKPETLHFILAVTDKGTPALTRYKRVIVTVGTGTLRRRRPAT